MNDEQFDKELSALYQQRKSQIIAPNITLPDSSGSRKYSLLKLLSIFTLGGIASFSILALITHFATTPEHNQRLSSKVHSVDIAKNIIKKADEKALEVTPKLPDKPEPPKLALQREALAPLNNETSISGVKKIALHTVQLVQLPHLKEPDFLINPVYKVMPKFSYKALKDQQSGTVKFRYEIDELGKVINIEVITSEVSRELQRSAKKALAKWRYNPSDNVQTSYEIIFQFNLEK